MGLNGRCNRLLLAGGEGSTCCPVMRDGEGGSLQWEDTYRLDRIWIAHAQKHFLQATQIGGILTKNLVSVRAIRPIHMFTRRATRSMVG